MVKFHHCLHGASIGKRLERLQIYVYNELAGSANYKYVQNTDSDRFRSLIAYKNFILKLSSALIFNQNLSVAKARQTWPSLTSNLS